MTTEGVVGLIAGFQAGSIALIGWALGSAVEGLASIIVVWRFTGTRTLSETAERRAQHGVAISFWLLAPYVAAEAIRDLAGAHHPETSWLGIGLTTVALLEMPLLGRAKQKLGARLDSAATAGEGRAELPLRRPSRRRAHRTGHHHRLAKRLVDRPGDRSRHRCLGHLRRQHRLARSRLRLLSPPHQAVRDDTHTKIRLRTFLTAKMERSCFVHVRRGGVHEWMQA
jgi:hypothetical protein